MYREDERERRGGGQREEVRGGATERSKLSFSSEGSFFINTFTPPEGSFLNTFTITFPGQVRAPEGDVAAT